MRRWAKTRLEDLSVFSAQNLSSLQVAVGDLSIFGQEIARQAKAPTQGPELTPWDYLNQPSTPEGKRRQKTLTDLAVAVDAMDVAYVYGQNFGESFDFRGLALVLKDLADRDVTIYVLFLQRHFDWWLIRPPASYWPDEARFKADLTRSKMLVLVESEIPIPYCFYDTRRRRKPSSSDEEPEILDDKGWTEERGLILSDSPYQIILEEARCLIQAAKARKAKFLSNNYRMIRRLPLHSPTCFVYAFYHRLLYFFFDHGRRFATILDSGGLKPPENANVDWEEGKGVWWGGSEW